MRIPGIPAVGPLPPLADTWRRSFVELLGTFTLVFAGAGTIMAVGPQADAGTLEVALATGLAVAVMVSAVGHISGGHFNPAITFGFMLTRRMSLLLGLAYWVAQFAGAVLAALLLRWIFPGPTANATNLGAPAVRGIDIGPALVVEALLTFFLVWVVFAMVTDPRSTYTAIAGLAIGFVIVFDMLIGYSLTGAAMNPARAFGPELVSGTWDDFWIWYVGPLAGGAIAALLYDELYLRSREPVVPVGPPETGVEEPGPGLAARD
jgi:aquaporin TIP